MDSPARTRNFTTVAFSLFQRFAVTDSALKVHRRHHGGRPCSCRLRSRRERLTSPTPHDKSSYRWRIRNSRTNRQEMANIPLLVDNAKRQTTFKRLVAPTLRIRAVSWPRVVPLSFFLVELMLDVPEADWKIMQHHGSVLRHAVADALCSPGWRTGSRPLEGPNSYSRRRPQPADRGLASAPPFPESPAGRP